MNIMNLLIKILGVGIRKVCIVSGFDIVIEVNSKNIYPLILFLNKHTVCQFKSIIDIICYDNPKKNCRFTLIYNLISFHNNRRIRVLTKINELSPVFSLMGIFKGAN
jgi:NADH:ubiquinone oxidoreductase subunit C